MIFALISVPLMGLVGMAVDGTRWYLAKQKTSEALDAGVLAGARKMQLDPTNASGALASALTAYNANIARRVETLTDTVAFALTDNNTAVTATGQVSMKTTFLSVVGLTELPLFSPATGKGTKATFLSGLNGGTDLEVSLVLDFTGSMCADGQGPCSSGTKVDGLRAASKELVDIVVSADQSAVRSRVALVPFSTRIRVEPDSGDGAMMKQLTNLDPTWSGWMSECVASTGGGGGGEGGGSWTCTQVATSYKSNWTILPCVTDRIYGSNWDASDIIDYTDTAPGPGRWLNAHGGDRRVLALDSTDTNVAVPGPTGTETEPVTQWNYADSRWCADVANENVIVPLSSDKDALKTKIDSFSAGGATAGPLATAFGWYMLSPKWSSIWPSSATPGPYSDLTARRSNGAPVLRKVAVIMTDGVYNVIRGEKDRPANTVNPHASAMCTAMKAAGIEIYTVGFALDQLSSSERAASEAMLQGCGTSVRHFYSTITVEQLQTAFRDIALKVTPIRLTQ